VKETAVVIDGGAPLVGVIASPDARLASPDAPVILLLSAGLIHHVGPNRLYVTLSRRLATAGFTSFRFDFSGVGDSPARRDNLGLDAAVLRDAQTAMDFLSRTSGATRFVLLGLCLGAHHAFRIACRDPRVVGVVMIDGYAYPTGGYHVRRTLQRVRRARSWRRLIGGLGEWARAALRSRRGGQSDPLDNLMPEDLVRMPPKDEVLADLRALIQRDTRCLFIFTERGMEVLYNHERQMFETFPQLRGHSQLAVEFIRGTDHTFTLLRHQRAVVDVIEKWARAFRSALRWTPPLPQAANGNGTIAVGRPN
jgi:pimeloyl-ACP methyl ester carboxylesterase